MRFTIFLLLAATVAAAELPIEDLGEPIRTMRRSGDFTIPRPDGGWWFLTSYNPVARNELPMQIALVDLATGATRVESLEPGGAFVDGWHNHGVTGHDGYYYLGHYARLGVWRFNPADGSLRFFGAPELAELRVLPFTMAQAPHDDTIYLGGASHRSQLVAFDPKSTTFRDLGTIGPVTSPRYLHGMAVADDYVYAVSAKNPWLLVAVNRVSGEARTLLEGSDLEYLTVSGAGDGCRVRVTRRTADGKTDTTHPLRGGQLLPPETAPTAPAPATPRPPAPELQLTLARPTSDGRAQVWWRLPGQDDWRHADLAGIQTIPWPIERVHPLPDGRLLGVPEAYEDWFVYDPASRQFTIVGKSPLSAYTIENLGGKTYVMGYPGSYMVEYDPARPWTYFTTTPTSREPALADAASNPRECHRWSTTGLNTHHIRASAIGADGCVYFGAHAERSAVGGGLGWWDPATRTPGGLRDPFVVQDCGGLTAARDGATIVYSSQPVSDPGGVIPTPAEGQLYLFDTASKALAGSFTPIPGMSRCGPVFGLGDRVIGVGKVSDGWVLYAVDVTTGTLLHRQPVTGAPRGEFAEVAGKLYLFLGQTLVRIDPAGYALTELGTVTATGPLAALGGDLYWPAGSYLCRLPDVAAR